MGGGGGGGGVCLCFVGELDERRGRPLLLLHLIILILPFLPIIHDPTHVPSVGAAKEFPKASATVNLSV